MTRIFVGHNKIVVHVVTDTLLLQIFEVFLYNEYSFQYLFLSSVACSRPISSSADKSNDIYNLCFLPELIYRSLSLRSSGDLKLLISSDARLSILEMVQVTFAWGLKASALDLEVIHACASIQDGRSSRNYSCRLSSEDTEIDSFWAQ